ncbi:hypothetical protein [Desulfogranum mediterraneum]|uniref:hypothetical protein n=1 Tax=Desulfogranum mediterraneum TaxID=160661 RepID=UPI0003FBA545|nr:hypothetical protein [Desulfogranum mediterraneum]
MSKSIRIVGVLFWLSAMVGLGGCVSLPRGELVPDAQVSAMFKSATVLPGYSYYTTGPRGSANAVIALNRQYRLISRLWSPLAQPDQQLAAVIAGTREQRSPMCFFSGAVIRDLHGETVGYWYSKWERSAVRFPEPGLIQVFPPVEPDVGPCAPEGALRW